MIIVLKHSLQFSQLNQYLQNVNYLPVLCSGLNGIMIFSLYVYEIYLFWPNGKYTQELNNNMNTYDNSS